MDQHPNAPGNETEPNAPRPPQTTGKSSQEVLGPTDSLGKSGLDLGLLRMELETSMEHALRHRRNVSVVVEQIRAMALHTDASANRCVYALPRKEKAIIGPSVGLATIIATAWGNCVDSGWWVRTDRENKVVVCAGSFIDLQANRRSGATVTRRISDKYGRIYNDDMIAVTIQAATSIAQRNSILKGVPAPIWWPIYEEALVVVRGTMETLPERRQKMVAAFAQFGVEARKILGALGVPDEKGITLDHMVMLRGMYEQLRDEQITADELFDPRRMTSEGFDKVEQPLGDDEVDEVAAGNGRTAANGAAGAAQQKSPAASSQGPGVTGYVDTTDKMLAAQQDVAKQQQPQEARGEPSGERKAAEVSTSAQAASASPGASSEAGGASQAQTGDIKFPEPWIRRSPSDYVEYAETWMRQAKSAADIDDRWKAERKMRNGLSAKIDGAEMEELTRLKDAAVDRYRKEQK